MAVFNGTLMYGGVSGLSAVQNDDEEGMENSEMDMYIGKGIGFFFRGNGTFEAALFFYSGDCIFCLADTKFPVGSLP